MSQTFRFAHYLLAVEGMALMRSWLRENDKPTAERIAEITKICDALDQPPQSNELEMHDVTPAQGYAVAAVEYKQDQGTDSLAQLDMPILRRLLESIPPGKALDAACGTGRQTRLLVDYQHDVTGVDLTPEMLQYAQEHVNQARFLPGNLQALPFPKASFDLVTCSLALTHIPDLNEPIQEIARVVRPEGRVILTDLHPMQVALGGEATFPFAQNKFVLIRNYLHLHSEYMLAFTRAGLRVQECIEPTYTPETAALLWAAPHVPQANLTAYVGTPAMLIWHLQKEKKV